MINWTEAAVALRDSYDQDNGRGKGILKVIIANRPFHIFVLYVTMYYEISYLHIKIANFRLKISSQRNIDESLRTKLMERNTWVRKLKNRVLEGAMERAMEGALGRQVARENQARRGK
jgi:hypothetical protein